MAWHNWAWSDFAPLAFSRKIFSAPAAFNSASWASSVWPSVEPARSRISFVAHCGRRLSALWVGCQDAVNGFLCSSPDFARAGHGLTGSLDPEFGERHERMHFIKEKIEGDGFNLVGRRG
jgi:hypothetical protein